MEQGRLAGENLQKSIMQLWQFGCSKRCLRYTLCSKLPQVLPALFEVFGLPLALAAAQVLLIDIGTDIWTAVAFAAQEAEASLMSRKPRHPQRDRMVGRSILAFSYGYMGCLQCLRYLVWKLSTYKQANIPYSPGMLPFLLVASWCVLVPFFKVVEQGISESRSRRSCFCWLMYFLATPGIGLLMKADEPVREYTPEERVVEQRGMTVYYWSLVLGQVAAAYACTTKSQPLFGPEGYGIKKNSLLNIAVSAEITLSLLVMHVPWLTAAFEMQALHVYSLLLPLIALVAILAIDECRKRFGPQEFLIHG